VLGSPVTGPLENGLRESLRGVAAALLGATTERTILVNGFQTPAADPEEYAQFIDRTLEERARRISGRWFTCPARGGFLHRVPPLSADRRT
jgi:hypothetical protein